jgi:hypothetical protein
MNHGTARAVCPSLLRPHECGEHRRTSEWGAEFAGSAETREGFAGVRTLVA